MKDDLPESAIRKLLDDDLDHGDNVRDLGRYRLIRELGRGAMGVVWEAEDLELQRRVALKILSTPLLGDQDARRRFVREAQAAAKLNHPGVAAIYDATDRMLAMQLVDGAPLSLYPHQNSRLMVRFIRDAALAVHHAHERGIIHRDIKPSNLLIEEDRILVADFGLAKETALDSSISVSGSILGTPAYMAPEQAEGRLDDIDPRTDVYSLGATLYDLLAGRPPFVERDVYRLLRLVVESAPPPMRASRKELSRDLEIVVQKCLAKERERRYQSAQELAEDLTRWLDGEAIWARPPSVRYRMSKFVLKRKAVVAVAALGLLGISITFLVAHFQEKAAKEVFDLNAYVDVRMDDAGLSMARDTRAAAARRNQAIERCLAYLKRNPDVAYAHYLLGRLLRSSNRDDEARRALDRAIEEDPSLTEAYLERGILGAMSFCVERSRLENPVPDPDAVDLLPKALRKLRAQALEDLQVIHSSRDPRWRHIDETFGRALLARLQGDPKETRRQIEQVLRLNRLHLGATIVHSQLLVDEGDPDRARYLAMRASDVMRGFGTLIETSTDSFGSSEDEIAAEREDWFARLHVSFAQAVFAVEKVDSRSALAYEQSATNLVEKIDGLLAEGDLRRAIEAFDEAAAAYTGVINTEPKAFAYSNRGACRWEKARLLALSRKTQEAMTHRDLAMSDYNQAIDMDASSPWARFNRGISTRFEVATGGAEPIALRAAIEDFGVSLTAIPHEASFLKHRALTHMRLAQQYMSEDASDDGFESYQEAWADLDLANRLKTQDAEILGYKGLCRGELGDIEGALEDLDLALRGSIEDQDARQRFEEARLHWSEGS